MHFWHYSPQEYGWIDEPKRGLRRDLLPHDLAPELALAGVNGVVAVQARQTLEETAWLLQLSDMLPWIRGVVGWLPLASPTFDQQLEKLAGHKQLRGLRHIVEGEQDPEFLLRAPFAAGIRHLQGTGLVYDLLIKHHQLPQVIRFVDQHPNQLFVLDHLGKPDLTSRLMEPWQAHIADLARRPHVYCKLSGLATEADWGLWTNQDLWPYIEVALEAFGPNRMMAGSDWPVCTLAASYGRWIETLRLLLRDLSGEEQDRVFGGTAGEAYQLAL